MKAWKAWTSDWPTRYSPPLMLLTSNIGSVHLIYRTLIALLVRWAPAPANSKAFWDSSSLISKRVLPTDVDLAFHMNNGMYLSQFDLGRLSHMQKSGVWQILRRHGWATVAATSTITYRKSLNLFKRYQIVTQVLGCDEKNLYFRQAALVHGEVYAQATVGIRIVSASRSVPLSEFFAAIGSEPAAVANALPDWIAFWREETALPSSKAPALFGA